MLLDHRPDIGVAGLGEQQRRIRRSGPHPPQLFDNADHGGIAGDFGDGQVQVAVRQLRTVGKLVFNRNLVDQVAQMLEISIGNIGRGKRCGLPLDQDARLGQFEGGDIKPRCIPRAGKASHIGTRTHLDLDNALHLQRDNRFPHRGATDRKFHCQFTLRRQAVTQRIGTCRQLGEELARQFLIKSAIGAAGRSRRFGFDCLQG